MKPFLLLILFLFFVLINTKEPKESNNSNKTYKVSDVISLIKSSNQKGYKIIDPDDYIKYEDEKLLSKTLKDIYEKHKLVTFIIVFHHAYLKDEDNNDIDLSYYTKLLTEEIYEQKIVGKKDPIIIAIISIDGKIMSMKTEGTVSRIITQQDCFNILSIINNYFSYGEYSYGTVELGQLINYYLENTGFFARNKRYFFLIVLLLFCFFLCYICALIAQKIKDRRNLRLTMSDEEKLLKIREFLKKTRANRKILSDNCIICLEPFDNCISINHTISQENKEKENKDILIDIIDKDTNINTNLNTNVNTNEERNIQLEMQSINNNSEINVPIDNNIIDNRISTLPCGHRYHVKCITEWMLHRQKICPMCREKINVDIPENDDEAFQNELLNIQIELHPAFALLVFQTINEELTWGAMTLPVLNGGLFSGLAGFALI